MLRRADSAGATKSFPSRFALTFLSLPLASIVLTFARTFRHCLLSFCHIISSRLSLLSFLDQVAVNTVERGRNSTSSPLLLVISRSCPTDSDC